MSPTSQTYETVIGGKAKEERKIGEGNPEMELYVCWSWEFILKFLCLGKTYQLPFASTSSEGTAIYGTEHYAGVKKNIGSGSYAGYFLT